VQDAGDAIGGLMYPLPKLGQLLTIDDFLPHVGATYLVQATPKPIEIRLETALRRPGEPWMPREPFLLSFSSVWSALLLEGRYTMQPTGGTPVELYIIPTQTFPGERRLYHAVVN
jgi:hypothetical protein